MDEFTDLIELKTKEESPDKRPKESVSRSGRTLSAVCASSASRNLMVWIAILASCGVAGGIAMPLLGASWFGDCLEKDGKTIIDDFSICVPDYRVYNLFSTIFWSIGGFLSFVFSGFLGRVSDSFGRKLLIGLALMSHLIPRGVIAFYVNFVVYFAVSTVISLPDSVYTASIADMFPHSKSLKTVAFALFSAMDGLGFLFGGGISLLVSALCGNHMVFVVIFVILCGLIPYWWFLIEETLPKESRKPFTTRNYNPFRPLLNVFSNEVITYSSVLSFNGTFVSSTLLSISLSFAGDQFNMASEFETNLIFALVSLFGGLGGMVSGIILMPILKKKRVKNINIMIGGSIVAIIAFFMLAITTVIYEYRIELYLSSGFLFGISNIGSPAGTGIVSHHLYKTEHGVGFGITSSYSALAGIIAPGLMGWLYFQFTQKGVLYFPSFIWYVCEAFNIISLLIIIGPFSRLLNRLKDEKQHISHFEIEESYEKDASRDASTNEISMGAVVAVGIDD